MAQKEIEEMKSHCMTTLEKLGASEEIIKFYSEALECEYDISLTIYKLQSKLKNDVDNTGSLPPNVTFGILQTMTKHFRTWKKKVEKLTEKGITVPPLQINVESLNKLKMLTAVCSMDTNQMNLKEGEELQITDASHPNWLKVRNIHGKEGFLPAMSCLIPTPDNNAITAVERLQVLLLTSWTESIRELRSILASTCVTSSQELNQKWGSLLLTDHKSVSPKMRDKLTTRLKRISECSSRTNINLDLNRLHHYLSKLENDLLNVNTANNGLAVILRSVEGLDRAVLCYQSLFGQWASFRKSLNESSRPIRIVEQWEELRRAARFKKFKYYEMKMTLEEVDTAEEIIYINSETGETFTSECRKKRQKVISEELTSTKHEEKKKFIIKGVVDPRSGDNVAFKYAVAEGIIDHANGLYVNPLTGEGIPIQKAMSEGRIVVEYTSVHKGVPETTAVPLITVKKRSDRKYVITGALDPRTAERVGVDEAVKRGLIDPRTGEFVNEEKGGLRTPEKEAVEDGWILADFDDSSPLFESETFAVVAVYDDKFNYFTSFLQAVRKGLIDPETGNYISNKSGKRIYAADAIKRGLIKTKKCSSDITEADVFKAAVKSFRDSKKPEFLSPSLKHVNENHANTPINDVTPPTSILPNGNISDPSEFSSSFNHLNHVTPPHHVRNVKDKTSI